MAPKKSNAAGGPPVQHTIKKNTAAGKAAPKAAPAVTKVTIKKSIADKVKSLNSEEVLYQPLKLGVIARALSEIDEAASLEILDRLLAAASEIEDPNAWVCSEAATVAAGVEVEVEEEADDEWAEGGSWEGGGQEEGQEWEENEGQAEENEEEEEEEEPSVEVPIAVAKIIHRINSSGALASPLDPELDPLFALVGEERSMELLRDLRNKAEEINNPSGWVKKALEQNVSKVVPTICRMNRGGELAAPINLVLAADALSLISEAAGEELLQELQIKAWKVKDPTKWLVGRASKQVSKAARRAKLLSQNVKHEIPMRLSRIVDILEQIEEKEALRILQDVKEKGTSISNPTAWICCAAQRVAEATTPWNDQEWSAADERVHKKIKALNKSGELAEPIEYTRVKAELDKVDEKSRLNLLKVLEEKAATIEHPTGWLVKACRQSAANFKEYAMARTSKKAAAWEENWEGGEEWAEGTWEEEEEE